MPEVVADPQGEVAQTFQNLGVCVVQQCAKIRQQGDYLFSVFFFLRLALIQVALEGTLTLLILFLLPVSTAVTYDRSMKAIRVKVPDSDEEFFLHPATVRRNDRSAQSVVCVDFFSLIIS